MSKVDDLLPAFRRTISVPGGFDDLFPEATNNDLRGRVLDALAGAQLDGFLRDVELEEVDGALHADPDLSIGEGQLVALTPRGALVIVYADYYLLRNELLNRKSHVKYQGVSGISFEEDHAASLLVELLKQAQARINDMKEASLRRPVETIVVDMAFIKATTDYGFGIHPLQAWGY